MSQEQKPFAHRGEILTVIPKASTNISSGDYVVMPRNVDPISRAVLGAESRISPAGSAFACQWGVGIVDSDFTTNTVGSTLYATPTSDQALPVIRRGVVRLAIVQTSGKAGDLVMYSSGATGAQLFKINNFRRDVAVGRLWKDFSSATANDPQLVELIEKPLSERDVYFWLQNRPITGCFFKQHSVVNQQSTQLMGGATNDQNAVLIKGRQFNIARVTDFTIGAINPGASDIRFYWLAAKVSTTGVAPAFTKETCTGPFTAIASYTVSAISAGMMIPITWTSNMIPLGMVMGFSNTEVSIPPARIFNLDGYGLPPGPNLIDATKWYL